MPLEGIDIVAPNRRKHAEGIYDLVAEQWREDLRRHAREGRIAHSHYDWKTSRIALSEGRVVAHFGVYNLLMRIGTARVATAGVNLVVTDPEFRKRGLMPTTIRASMDAMQTNGYDFSIVCNAIAGYYTRFGYVSAWPESDFYVRTRDLPSEPPTYKPRRSKPGSRPEFAELYNRENSTLTGTVVRPTFLRTKEPNELLAYLWSGEDGVVAGYVIYDIISNGKAVWHYNSAGDPVERLRVLGMVARQEECEEVRFNRLPFNSALAQTIRASNCTIEFTYRPTGGWLARIVNLQTLFEKLAAELSRRLACSYLRDWQGNLLISTDRESVLLSIDKSHVQVLPGSEADPCEHSIQGGEYIARLVLGSEAPEELISAHSMVLSGNALELACVLFPAQHPQMGNADL